ncbi:putative ficolin-2-like [Apostichopus japonicus]|uniref:Putative ficolin-2-like n=1 Tax=Stichopus japonicus TaxID=307972 RepID=A0A2G8JVW8_STIJA|nr:putative ficolin-2-like [Apostichopus japonicus]
MSSATTNLSASDSTLEKQEGGSYVNPGCTRKGVCTNGQITWDEAYACSPNAVCDVRDNIRQCYCTGGYRGDGETCTRPPKDCQEIYDDGSRDSGIYRIKPTGWTSDAFEVYCNMTDGGGWTYIKLIDTALHCNKSSVSSFALIVRQIERERHVIDLVNVNGAPYYAKFDNFRINDESDKYRLSQLGTYSGTADSRSNPDGYALRYHLNYQFTTKDSDNDAYSNNCAVTHHGAWWYNNCDYSDLNSNYHADQGSDYSVEWYYLPGSYYNIKFSEMKIRPF